MENGESGGNGEKMESVADFIFLGSKTTEEGD